MVFVFIPIYLLKLGYSLSMVLLFFGVLSGTHALLVVPAAKIASKFGFKHSILFSIPFLITFYYFVNTIEAYNWPLLMIPIIGGISSALFWTGYHADFSKFSKRKSRAKQVCVAHIASSMCAVFGPLAGGLVLTYFGFNILFILAVTLFIISAVPLFFSKDTHQKMNFSLKQVFTNQKIKDGLAFFGHGIEGITSGIIWPIFIFFTILGSYVKLGSVVTFSMIFSGLVMILAAKFADKNRRLVLRIGIIAHSVIWFVKFFITTMFHVFVVDALHGMTRAARGVSYEALSYDKANKSKSIMEFIVFREILINAGASITILTMSLFLNYKASFVIAILGTLLQILF